jgi:pimeloyl-ACP methyl ester carboxylesterase
MQLLAYRPERVASLALINSAGFGSEVTMLLRMLAVPVIGPLSTRKPTRASARLLERTIYADPSLATKERIDHALAIGNQPDSGAVLRDAATALGTARGVKPGWRRQLAAFAALHPRPTLVMWGERDRVLPAHHIHEARRVFPHAESHLLPDIGHMPQIECPEKFADLVLPFLARVASEQRTTSTG